MTKNKEEVLKTVENNVETVTSVSEPFDFETFFENNKKAFTIGAGAIAALLVVFFGVKYYLGTQNTEAQEEMFQAQFYFKADSLDLALKGRGTERGFLQIKNDYPFTDAANLSSYYAGVIYLQKGDFKNAIEQLSDFSSSDALLQGRAYALLGDANMELNNFTEAKSQYQNAASYKPNKEFTPEYLYKLAVACEKAKDNEGALAAYTKIVDEYPNSEKANDAKKFKALTQEKLAK